MASDNVATPPKTGADDVAPPPKPVADDAALPLKTGGIGAEDAALPGKRNEPVLFRWKALPSADACMPVLGVAELWPELGSAAASTKGKGKAPASSTAPVAPKTTTATVPEQIQGAISKLNLGGASNSRYGDRAGSSSVMAPKPMNMMQNNIRERRVPAPRQPPPMHAQSHRNNNYAGARGHNQNGSFVPHPHGRGGGGGEGYNRGGGRPVGSANGRGQTNFNGNINGNAYRNRGGGGGWHGQEHRGGFNGQPPRGRGHHGPEHRPLGPPVMGYEEAPHPPPPLPPQQFMGMAPPPMPYSYYYGLPYGYQEFVPGYFAPPLQEALPPQFMPEALHLQYYYSGPPQMHMMHANFEQQQLYAQEQQLTPAELQQAIRQQIEFYFSAQNLEDDAFLRGKMDEQGWVPLTVVASFWKISRKTKDIEFILNSVLPSTEVEVQDGKIRKRVGWEEYLSQAPSN
ncbi:unnamed protein product [Urochloa humidicola]